ncbi:MAG: glycosyltransferase [Candidatus Lokiarchaeota archaeon]
MKIDPHISIIIVGPMDYNKFFIKCIKSYLNQSFKNFEIVLIIWGHKKIKEIKELMKRTKINTKQIKFIKYFGNPGYARGNNLGVVRSEYNYILISNPDVVVPRDFLKKLVESYFWLKELKNERIILGPRICNIDSEYQHSRRNINFLGFSNIDTSKTNKILRTEVTSGCAFLLEKELFKNLGGFDESYFMYHEDIDFSVRALKNSIKQYVNNSIRILHLRDSKKIKLNKFKYYYHERNRIKFTLEHSTKHI